MLAFASAMKKNDATMKFKLSCLFTAFSSKSAETLSPPDNDAFFILVGRDVNTSVKLHNCTEQKCINSGIEWFMAGEWK